MYEPLSLNDQQVLGQPSVHHRKQMWKRYRQREKQRTEERLKLAEQNIQLAEQNIKLAEQNIKLAEQREYESSKANCMDLFLFIYPNSDNSFLENLSTTQYNLLHKAILERKSIEELKSLVH